MRPIVPPSAELGGEATSQVILRDGSVAGVRLATPADRPALLRFFHDLSPESRRKRFLTAGETPELLIEQLADPANPSFGVTLIVSRQHAEKTAIIAAAWYSTVSDSTARVAFAVSDGFQGKGLGTALLERLAAMAAASGFKWFLATTLPDNRAMIEVLRDSGFELRAKSDRGVLDVRLDLAPSATAIAAIDERNRQATVASLGTMLEPRSVAVIGVSRETSGLGRRIFDAIMSGDFSGALHPVNALCDEVAGRRCYRSVLEIGQPIDLAVVVVPAEAVLAVVDQCAEAGVRALVVISAGFAETGDEGRLRQRALVQKVRGHGMRLVGPNCMGVLNASPRIRLNASLAQRLPPSGHIALASQSGGVGLALLPLAAERGIGISTFVSLGNKADVSGNDLLQYGESDPETSAVLLYLESFGNPRRFGQLARRIGRAKPIVVVKSGRTQSGTRAAGSHTAGLATSEAAVTALFRQSGVVRADTIDEMFDVAACLALQPFPVGKRVAIVTNTGGPGILAADACETGGLTVTGLSEATRARLAAGLSPNASVGNPIDFVAGAGPADYKHSIEVLLGADEVDALIVIYVPVDVSQSRAIESGIADGVAVGRSGAPSKTVLACVMEPGHTKPLAAGAETVPVYPFPENAAIALAKAAQYASWRAEPPGLYWGFDEVHAEEARALCQEVVAARGETWLTSEELTRVLNAFGLPVVAGAVARSEEEAAALAAIMGLPVVLKLIAPDVIHKSDIGGVRTNLTTEKAVRAAYTEICRIPRPVAAPRGDVVVQPMYSGVEMMVGLSDDPLFGPLVAFGLGGVDVEVLRDVGFRIAPLTDRDADDLIESIRSAPLLHGHRGRPPADVAALREVLLRVSLIGQHVPEIVAMDLNPVIALPEGHGCRVVDARAKVAPAALVPPAGAR